MIAAVFVPISGATHLNYFGKNGRFGAAGTTTAVGALGDPVAAPELMAHSA